jgi:uncharacterized protein YdaU (DUF1376 family)
MAKDPAFLFYPNDWIGGTMGMTFEEKGAYMELLMMQFNKGKFTKEQAKRTLNVSFDVVWTTLKDKFSCEDGFYHNVRLSTEKDKRSKFTESRRTSRLKSDEDNVKIYLIKDNDTKYIKIGSSVNPLRRFAEMKNQINPAITVGNRDYELLWISKILKRDIEKYIHKLYSKKRVSGEWFKLSEDDILFIKNEYGEETYVSRTEDVNENKYYENIGIAPEMFKIFKKHNSKYYHDKDKDFSACLSMAYKIAEIKGWDKKEVVDVKKNDVLNSWEKIVLFCATDKWFSTRALFDLNNEWQRVIQSMNGKFSGEHPIKEVFSPIKKESDTNFEKYIKNKKVGI